MEILTKKRFILAVTVILLVTFIYYILQSHFAYTRLLAEQENQLKSKAKSSASCTNYRVVSRCAKCPLQELRDLVDFCKETGFKELIECDNGKSEFIWCDISPAVEESDFWKFQAICLFLGLSSYSVVYLRQRKLDKILMEKIHRQIASGL